MKLLPVSVFCFLQLKELRVTITKTGEHQQMNNRKNTPHPVPHGLGLSEETELRTFFRVAASFLLVPLSDFPRPAGYMALSKNQTAHCFEARYSAQAEPVMGTAGSDGGCKHPGARKGRLSLPGWGEGFAFLLNLHHLLRARPSCTPQGGK